MERAIIYEDGINQELLLEDRVALNLLTSLAERRAIIQEILSDENKRRKFESFKQFEVYHERARDFVLEYLRSQFSEKTVSVMPVVDSIGISDRVVSKQATLYNEKPKREWQGLSAEQIQEVEKFYEEHFDGKFGAANEYFKLQDQSILWMVLTDDGLRARCLFPHQFDAIPNEDNPEIADAYIINAFDPSLQWLPENSDGENQAIADGDDYRQRMERARFLVWTKSVNFVFNGLGEIISTVKPNQLEELPFVDNACGKSEEFFVRGGRALTDFTIQFNGVLSDSYNVVKMQGWAVGFIKAAKESIPENIQIGPNMMVRLPIDPDKPEIANATEIGYSSPNADIAGTMQFLETLLALFLSSRGLDAKAISAKLDAQNFSSGVERLLAMLDVFEASKDDMKVFKKAEAKWWRLFVKWSNLLMNDPREELRALTFVVPENAELSVTYAPPTMAQTEKEKLDVIKQRKEMGLITQIEAIALDRGVDEETAEQIFEEIQSAKIEEGKRLVEEMDAAGLAPDGSLPQGQGGAGSAEGGRPGNNEA